MDDIYSSHILEFAGNITRLGANARAQATAERTARICGSRMRVWLSVEDGRVSEFSHEVSACALGKAAGAIMALNVVGAGIGEIRQARDDMLAMLKHGGAGPEGRFSQMRWLKPVSEHPSRHDSTMLTFEAVIACLDAIAARAAAVRAS